MLSTDEIDFRCRKLAALYYHKDFSTQSDGYCCDEFLRLKSQTYEIFKKIYIPMIGHAMITFTDIVDGKGLVNPNANKLICRNDMIRLNKTYEFIVRSIEKQQREKP